MGMQTPLWLRPLYNMNRMGHFLDFRVLRRTDWGVHMGPSVGAAKLMRWAWLGHRPPKIARVCVSCDLEDDAAAACVQHGAGCICTPVLVTA